MRIKPIKTEKDHEEALEAVERLMDQSPDPGSDDAEQLSILVTLIKDYESKKFPTGFPGPVAAIQFTMEQKNLKQADLIPYIGSRSRVSEILSGKRSLTQEMIRNLHNGLGIPLESLMNEPTPLGDAEEDIYLQGWSTPLVRDMCANGYFGDVVFDVKNKRDLIKDFLSATKTHSGALVGNLRQSLYRTKSTTDKNALHAWSRQVLKKAKEIESPTVYKDGTVTLDFMRDLVSLSIHDDGPKKVLKSLKESGIIVVIEPHLPKTRLDGAAFMNHDDNPVIGLTLRYDRIDNFWFTLMHELAHISLHYNDDISIFYDEDIDGEGEKSVNDPKEKEADGLAAEALVPISKWDTSLAKITPSPIAIESFANELRIHPAIVAGYMRHKKQNYRYARDIVNKATIHHLFGETNWKKK